MDASQFVWINLDDASPERLDEQKRFMQRMTAVMFILAALVLLAAAAVPKPDTSDRPWDIGVALVMIAWGAPFPFLRRPPVWLFKASCLISIATCSVIVGAARPLGATPFFYLWPITSCAYCFSRNTLRVALAWMTLTFGVALAFFADTPIKGIMFWSVITCVAFMGVTVSELRARGLTLVADLERASTTDPLTGLLNRRAFSAAFEREVERAVDAGLPLSVAVFDLDHFKALNDALGHAGGDAALCSFAEVLREAARPGDLIARLGGEEFVVVLFNDGPEAAERFAEGIGRRLRTHTVSGGLHLSTSAGVATLGRGTSDPDKLLLLADKALYAAKDAGRSRVALWDDGVVVGRPVHGLDAIAS
jgi:diguanylate cyclase (GGDEF)-like protein